jgi:hypothetical protein
MRSIREGLEDVVCAYERSGSALKPQMATSESSSLNEREGLHILPVELGSIWLSLFASARKQEI